MILDENFLKLPKIVDRLTVKKTTIIQKPNIETLTKEQLEIFQEITKISTNVFSQSLLTGYSGTGKSFLVSKIIEELLFTKKSIRIAITAPTNKAVRVLKNLSMISDDNARVDFITLHSLLGLKRNITHEGKEEYKQLFNGGNLDEYSVVLVDEVSMLDNELYWVLKSQAEINKIMVLFIGDRAQIPPVNGGESILFSSLLDNNYNLTEIIRQSNGNPIIKLAETIRQNEKFEKETIMDENNNGVAYLKINTEEPLLDMYFNSEHFRENANFVKVLAWTNSAVNYYNSKIRTLIYGENCGKLCVGEKMVCNKPITNSKNQVILNNNDEFEVISFVMKKETRSYDFSYYEVTINCDGNILKIKLLAEKSETAFSKQVNVLKKAAENAKVMDRRSAWTKYYKFLERYADVKYNYALTVHKSQGSTFDNVIVINVDINRVLNQIERNKLLYTAITRAKNRLFVI